jgi:hypothetical protein
MKIKYLKNLFLILCIFFLASFNYFSLAATTTKNNAVSLDSDNDGLSDNEENLYGTDPKNPDTDGDGYSDGVEVKSGYSPIKAAPEDRVVVAETNNLATQTKTSQLSLTDTFMDDFQKFIATKDGQAISAEEVKKFTDAEFAAKVAPTDISTLPEVDRTKIKIKAQKYSSLSDTDRKKELQKDAAQYLNQMSYLLVSNAPVPITSATDFSVFQQDFSDRLLDSTSAENIIYFADMSNRLDTFSQQLETLEIPETMLELHIKFIQIIKGALSLRTTTYSASTNDPMGKIISLTKARDLITLFSDLFTNDLSNYIKQISTI